MKLCLLIIFAQLLIAFARYMPETLFEGDIDLRGYSILAYVDKFEPGYGQDLPVQANVNGFEPGYIRSYPTNASRNAIKEAPEKKVLKAQSATAKLATKKLASTRNLANITGDIYRWKNGEIPYVIPNKFNEYEKNKILSAIEVFDQMTCIKWIKRTTEPDYVIFDTAYKKCSANIGKLGGRQYIDLGGPGCVTKGMIIHEMMHVLGFFHEQSRLDRNEYVKIIWDNIKSEDLEEFNMYAKDEIEDLGFPYDYDSVMHYKRDAFAKDNTITIVPIKDRSASIGQRIGLSETDRMKVNKLYKCSGFDGRDRSTGNNKENAGNGNCVDEQTPQRCDSWALDGYCFYAGDSAKYCPRTCMLCSSCENTYESKYCQFYKNNGFCSKFEKVMSYRCMKTCNKCSVRTG